MRVPPWDDHDPDPREPALRIDMKSLVVHHVRKVEFCTTSYPVSRSRYDMGDVDF